MAGLAIQLREISVVSPPAGQAVEEFCRCDFFCEYKEQVFAKDGGDPHQKDYSSFLAMQISSFDTTTIKLFKNGLEVATISDSSYGSYYAIGDFAAQPLYTGWVADWTLIFLAFSGGIFQVKIEQTIAGSSRVWESRKFRLNAYDIKLANKTVRIETKQTGNILSSDFDYTELLPDGWPQSIRIAGRFGDKTPTLETDRYLDTSYNELQNRDQVRYEYTLELRNCPQSIFNLLSSDQVLANSFIVTDYDVFSDVIYRAVPVVVDSFSEVNHFSNGNGNYTITCSDKVKNTIKRNF